MQPVPRATAGPFLGWRWEKRGRKNPRAQPFHPAEQRQCTLELTASVGERRETIKTSKIKQHFQLVKGRGYPTLLCTAVASPQVLCAILGSTIPKKDIKLIESFQRGTTRMAKGLEGEAL